MSLRFILKEKSPYAILAQNCLKLLIKDPIDNVKVFALETLVSQRHNIKFFMNTIYQILIQSFEEQSWRMRFVMVNNIYNVLSSVQKNSMKVILNKYAEFLVDQEPEVRINAYLVLKEIGGLLSEEFIIDKIIPSLHIGI